MRVDTNKNNLGSARLGIRGYHPANDLILKATLVHSHQISLVHRTLNMYNQLIVQLDALYATQIIIWAGTGEID